MAYNPKELVIGPMVGLYWDVTPPAPNTKLVLDGNGHPADGVLLGYTDRGATLTVGWQAPPEEAWDAQEKYRVVQANQMSIEGTLVQTANLGLMQFLLAPMYLGGGGSLATFGAATKPQRSSITMIFTHLPLPDLSIYGYAMIYDAVNTAPFSFAVTRRDLTRVAFHFDARPVFSRGPTDQIGSFTTWMP